MRLEEEACTRVSFRTVIENQLVRDWPESVSNTPRNQGIPVSQAARQTRLATLAAHLYGVTANDKRY